MGVVSVAPEDENDSDVVAIVVVNVITTEDLSVTVASVLATAEVEDSADAFSPPIVVTGSAEEAVEAETSSVPAVLVSVTVIGSTEADSELFTPAVELSRVIASALVSVELEDSVAIGALVVVVSVTVTGSGEMEGIKLLVSSLPEVVVSVTVTGSAGVEDIEVVVTVTVTGSAED